MRFYWLRADTRTPHTGEVDAAPRWHLPGVRCSACGATWADAAAAYPCVDISSNPQRAELEKPRPEPSAEFERLRELIRPLIPRGALLPPGTGLGPAVGTARGSFGAFCFDTPWALFIRREALDALRQADLRGLQAARAELRFRQKNPPELWELQFESHGLLHPDCLPPDRAAPCPRCGRDAFTRPEEPVLDLASLPEHLDLLRLAHCSTLLIVTERFAHAVRRLGLGGIELRELPACRAPVPPQRSSGSGDSSSL
jgi:uncharacterized double-CXXCG motif protein